MAGFDFQEEEPAAPHEQTLGLGAGSDMPGAGSDMPGAGSDMDSDSGASRQPSHSESSEDTKITHSLPVAADLLAFAHSGHENTHSQLHVAPNGVPAHLERDSDDDSEAEDDFDLQFEQDRLQNQYRCLSSLSF